LDCSRLPNPIEVSKGDIDDRSSEEPVDLRKPLNLKKRINPSRSELGTLLKETGIDQRNQK